MPDAQSAPIISSAILSGSSSILQNPREPERRGSLAARTASFTNPSLLRSEDRISLLSTKSTTHRSSRSILLYRVDSFYVSITMSSLSQRQNPFRELWLNQIFWRAWIVQGIFAFSIPLLTMFAAPLLYKLIPHRGNPHLGGFFRGVHATGGGEPEDTAPLGLSVYVLKSVCSALKSVSILHGYY